jgi:hypothetical protein
MACFPTCASRSKGDIAIYRVSIIVLQLINIYLSIYLAQYAWEILAAIISFGIAYSR